MRDYFIFVLKAQAWLSLVGGALLGYLYGAASVTLAADKLVFGGFGAAVGAVVGAIGLVTLLGLADLAQSIWRIEETVTPKEVSMQRREKELRRAP